MDVEIYNEMVSIIHNHKDTTNLLTQILLEKYSSVKKETLESIISNEWQKITRRCHHKNPEFVDRIFKEYMEARAKDADSSAASNTICCYSAVNRKKLVEIGIRNRLPPTLIARVVLTKFYETREGEQDEVKKLTKRNITDMLADSNLIDDLDLSMEVYWAMLYDDQYSPVVEVMKKWVSSLSVNLKHPVDYKIFRNLGHEYEHERKLRKDGYDKTPDIKLEVPILVDGVGITWIESKALFGDEEVHNNYIRDQYSSYWNRWGPGLVIYWFGYVETIQTSSEKRFIIKDHFPESSDITHLSYARPDDKTLDDIQTQLDSDIYFNISKLQTGCDSKKLNDNIIDALKQCDSNLGSNTNNS